MGYPTISIGIIQDIPGYLKISSSLYALMKYITFIDLFYLFLYFLQALDRKVLTPYLIDIIQPFRYLHALVNISLSLTYIVPLFVRHLLNRYGWWRIAQREKRLSMEAQRTTLLSTWATAGS